MHFTYNIKGFISINMFLLLYIYFLILIVFKSHAFVPSVNVNSRLKSMHYTISDKRKLNNNLHHMNKKLSSNLKFRLNSAITTSINQYESKSNDNSNLFVQIIENISSFTNSLWKFTRPHTIIGSIISIVSLFLYVSPIEMINTSTFYKALFESMIPAILMNIYITGLNQITDVDIDKINKPYLPLASGEMSMSTGISVVMVSLVIASYMGIQSNAWPLQLTLFGSAFLGTIYSLPPFRLKRFPLLAALCILVVRGSLVNMGFLLQARIRLSDVVLPSSIISACTSQIDAILVTAFFAFFGVVIALMKDVPDVKGDRMNSISSFSVKVGPSTMFSIAWKMLATLLKVSGIATLINTMKNVNISSVGVTSGSNNIKIIGQLIASISLLVFGNDVTTQAKKVDADDPDAVFQYYMRIWNIFYACYLIIPLTR